MTSHLFHISLLSPDTDLVYWIDGLLVLYILLFIYHHLNYYISTQS